MKISQLKIYFIKKIEPSIFNFIKKKLKPLFLIFKNKNVQVERIIIESIKEKWTNIWFDFILNLKRI